MICDQNREVFDRDGLDSLGWLLCDANEAWQRLGIVYNKSEARVQKAAVDALLANGFVIGRSDTDYVDGSRPHKMGLMVGSGGESAAVWLSPLGPSRTAVKVSTAKSLLGILGQKNWDAEIIAEI